MKKIVCKNNCNLLELIKEHFPLASFGSMQKLLRQKEIKVNGSKVNQNVSLNINDQVEVYGEKALTPKIEIIYSDENILVVNKPMGIEVCDGSITLKTLLEAELNANFLAVHRLDRNTSGLVVFAKNKRAESDLNNAFKKHAIYKYYLAEVVGKPLKQYEVLNYYLKKDPTTSLVKISSKPLAGYFPIFTTYKVIQQNAETEILEISIKTGKTHQIRAQMAYIGLPIVGDNKYGDKNINRKFKKSKQQLVAYKIILNGLKTLDYLNLKEFKLDVDFDK